MDNGIYIMTTRQQALFKAMEVTANNLANANTNGYHSEETLFSAYLEKDNNSGQKNKMAFSRDEATFINTTQGSIKATGNPLDVAIDGNAYFQVQTPLGNRFTKAGNFTRNGEGTIVNQEGYPVLDNNGGVITLPEEAQNIEIGETGTIKVDGQEFATLNLAQFANEQALQRSSGTLFLAFATPQQAENARVVQGAVENSNVQPIRELTQMIEISRQTTGTAKYIETMYDLQRKANTAYAQAA